uniref:Uncharacterized protein n=1 Tax=Rhipicephalus microplus TaxID=6941 RepID=A0A6G5AIT5_RHIMP
MPNCEAGQDSTCLHEQISGVYFMINQGVCSGPGTQNSSAPSKTVGVWAHTAEGSLVNWPYRYCGVHWLHRLRGLRGDSVARRVDRTELSGGHRSHKDYDHDGYNDDPLANHDTCAKELYVSYADH